ncbi:MAG: sigma-70 family RNA polymerase sigma factor [Blastocatellia bacterium]|nr:sigma-70 family RNA polymerase sigma factor [Blastocatellia bacterium]
MSPVPDKLNQTVDDALELLLARAGKSRGLLVDDVRPRIEKALDKYLFADEPSAGRAEVQNFIGEIRADDLCLITACERGDEKAWEDLVAGFDATVKSAARKISANAEDAEDLASSIWAELYGLRQDAEGNRKSKLAYYSGRGSLGGWLRAVVAQLAVDQFRKQSKLVQLEEDREFDVLANELPNSQNGLVAQHENPEEIMTESRTAADVTAALGSAIAVLKDEDRLILKLYYFEDLKLKNIAATFGFHEATASRRLARLQADIRKSVQKLLKTEYGWNDGEIDQYLYENAERAGVNFEKMLGIAVIVMAMQDFWA